MLTILRNNPKAFILALAIHLLLVLALSFSVDWRTESTHVSAEVSVIQAVMIDESKIKAEAERKKTLELEQRRKVEEEKRKKTEAEKQRKDEADKKQRELEQRKQVEQKKKQAAEEQRKVEQKRKADAEAKRKQAVEEQKRKDEQQRKQEAEKKRLAEAEQKRKVEAEKKRLAEVERQRKADEAQRRAEDDLIRQQQIAEEEAIRAKARLQVLQSEKGKYEALIQQRVSSKWLKPSGWNAGTECTVMVRLVPGAGIAQVIDVRIVKSSGDPLFDRSVKNAVYSASPLPIPTAPELIDVFREISFNFKPGE